MDYSAYVLRHFDAELAGPTSIRVAPAVYEMAGYLQSGAAPASNSVAPSGSGNDLAAMAQGFVAADAHSAGRWIIGEAEDRTLNVWIRFRVEVKQDVIGTVTPEVFGCPHMIAAAGWVSRWLAGAPVERLSQLDVNQLRQTLEVPVEKLGKLLRVEEALLACWADYRRRPDSRCSG